MILSSKCVTLLIYSLFPPKRSHTALGNNSTKQMCTVEPLHKTNSSHGKQGLGVTAHHYGWEDDGCQSNNVQDCIVLYLRHVLGHIAIT